MLRIEYEDRFAGREVRSAVATLARELAAAGVEAPGRDARILVAAATGGTAADLLRAPERRLTATEARTLEAHACRRAAREPVARILGERAFYGRMFHVSPATLDPRPCSETLVEAAIEFADAEGWRTRPIRILDVGTGTGCLLLTLLAELPLSRGLGTDVSPEALSVAVRNARRLGLSARARFEVRHLLQGMDETFDLLVTNPPYVASGDIVALEPEVRHYDPRAALDGGPDGLDAYRQLVTSCARVVPKGWALLEVGAGQANAVSDLFTNEEPHARRAHLRSWKDLGGHVRCVALRTQS